MLFRSFAAIAALQFALSASAEDSSLLSPESGRRYPRGSVCLYGVLRQMLTETARDSQGRPLERPIEMEIPLERVLPYLTTTDGTLAPLGLDRSAAWYRAMFGDQPPEAVRWDSRTPQQKKRVIDEATRGQDYGKDRVIHGLRVRPGSHPLGEFQGYVELTSASDSGNVVSVELHIRKPEPAARVALAVRAAARALNRPRQHLHGHLVWEVPERRLRRAPLLEAVKIGDYIRRMELFSQMMTVMETGSDLRGNWVDDSIAFESMRGPEVLNGLIDAFYRRAFGEPLAIHEKSAVGVRGEGFYDKPGTWGVEPRSLNRSYSDSQIAVQLNGFEESGGLREYGYAQDRVGPWLRQQGVELGDAADAAPSEGIRRQIAGRDVGYQLYPDYGRAFGQISVAHLNPMARDLWGVVAAKLKLRPLKPGEKRTWAQELDQGTRFSRLLRVIMHPWEGDVLFYDSAEARARIAAARIGALRKVLREEPLQEITREFLLDSRVFQELGKTLGIDVQVLEP